MLANKSYEDVYVELFELLTYVRHSWPLEIFIMSSQVVYKLILLSKYIGKFRCVVGREGSSLRLTAL